MKSLFSPEFVLRQVLLPSLRPLAGRQIEHFTENPFVADFLTLRLFLFHRRS